MGIGRTPKISLVGRGDFFLIFGKGREDLFPREIPLSEVPLGTCRENNMLTGWVESQLYSEPTNS